MKYTSPLNLYDKYRSDIDSLYRSAVDDYNRYVRYTQGYFRSDPIESEEMYDWYSVLYDLHIPRKGDNSDLINYMNRYDLDWDDLNFKKTMSTFGNGTVDSLFGAINFVSDNVKRLYR